MVFPIQSKFKFKTQRKRPPWSFATVVPAVLGAVITVSQATAASSPPKPLSTVGIPPAWGLNNYVKNVNYATLLGKALFWDMSVGSDGVSCASCHFHAGADSRIKNQMTPGLLRKTPDTSFSTTRSGGKAGPNYTLKPGDFPLPVGTNDAVTSQGVLAAQFISNPAINKVKDSCSKQGDPIFHVNGISTRKAEPRNSPSVINATFNFRNFWDGRANNSFNGIDPFGKRNESAFVVTNSGASAKVKLTNSSLASQAVGPPLSTLEMTCAGRAFADIAQKLYPRRALAHQKVHSSDSVLGRYRHGSGVGLNLTYRKLVELAFHSTYWQGGGRFGPNQQYSLAERNFSLFFGIALQMYQSKLVSNQAPYDSYANYFHRNDSVNANKQISDSARSGLNVFLNKGKCINCHKGPEFSSAASHLQSENREGGLVERMHMGDGGVALYDNGFYNIGVTPTGEDIGVGGKDIFGKPLSFSKQFVNGKIHDPIRVDPCSFEVKFSSNCSNLPGDLKSARLAVRGAFKTPILRNVELTGPYMHNGSLSSLEQVVDFYNRGGNVRNSELDPDIQSLGLSNKEKTDLVAFLKTLTDERVAFEKAPFDHPQLIVPHGHPGDENRITETDGIHPAAFFKIVNGVVAPAASAIELPAIGASGRAAEGLGRLATFEQILSAGGLKTENLAFAKSTRQNSTGWGGVSGLAVDGNTNGRYQAKSVTHTKSSTNPWWRVDLGKSATIGKIKLYNRTDCCSTRLKNFWVFVSDVDLAGRSLNSIKIDSRVFKQYHSGSAGALTEIALAARGRYVQVHIEGRRQYLSLAEVQVFPTVNLARNKTTTQSSTLVGGVSSRAVDGNSNGSWYGKSVTHTGANTTPWWQVDLGGDHNIGLIKLYNRTDCCRTRLRDYYVFVSKTDMSGRSLNSLKADSSVWKYFHPGYPSSNLSDIEIPSGTAGRYVRVVLSGKRKYLSLAEVEVYAK